MQAHSIHLEYLLVFQWSSAQFRGSIALPPIARSLVGIERVSKCTERQCIDSFLDVGDSLRTRVRMAVHTFVLDSSSFGAGRPGDLVVVVRVSVPSSQTALPWKS